MSELEPPVFNLSVNKENGEHVDQIPFVIRGHHLGNYITLIKDNFPYRKGVPTPAEEARDMRRFMEALPSAFTVLEKPDGSLEFRVPGFQEYSQDVIGTSAESADTYEERIRETFERFMSLPDDYPAEIVEGIPDIICSACAIGKHCKKLTTGLAEDEFVNNLEADRMYTEKFIETLDNLNLPKPTITQEQAYFSDAEPQQARRVKTTIGTVRRVLRGKGT